MSETYELVADIFPDSLPSLFNIKSVGRMQLSGDTWPDAETAVAKCVRATANVLGITDNKTTWFYIQASDDVIEVIPEGLDVVTDPVLWKEAGFPPMNQGGLCIWFGEVKEGVAPSYADAGMRLGVVKTSAM